MKKVKVLYTIAMMLLPMLANAAVEIDGIYYNLNSEAKTAEVTYYSSYSSGYWGDVEIPSEITYNGTPYCVSSVGIAAFRDSKALTSLKLPNTITSIGAYAFQRCVSLTSILIPSSVTSIGSYAFHECSELTSATVPESVTSIEEHTFHGCCSLTMLDIPNSLISIGEYAFYGCSSLTSFNIPNGVIRIEKFTFKDCSSLTSILIPNTVEEIGVMAFANCSSLISMIIPKSVTSIVSTAFSYCSSLKSLSVETGNPIYDSRNNCNAIIHTKNNIIIVGTMSTKIPLTVELIGAYAFMGCSGLKSISIADNISGIGASAFQDCINLKSVNINMSGYKTLGVEAFSGCTSLTSLVLNGDIHFSERSFKGCSSLKSITISSSYIDMEAFANCSGLTSVTLLEGVKGIYNDAFYGCSSLTSLNIPSSIEYIEPTAFSHCSNLRSIEVDKDNSVYDSRNNCNAIIETESNELIFGTQATVIPNSVTAIGNYAFDGCSNLTSITIPNSVTSIGCFAFGGCSSLTSVVIPNSVTNIAEYAFTGSEIDYSGIIRGGKSGLTSITIPNSVTRIEDWTFGNCQSLTNVTIPNSVTYIGYSAFQNCSSLTSITIPNSVTTIKSAAFGVCNRVTTITIGIGLTSIEGHTFSGCSNLREVYCYSEDVPQVYDYAFENTSIDNVYLYVPASSIEAYKTTAPWCYFKEIIALSKVSGDANRDGVVNAADIVEVLNFLIGNPSERFSETNADANEDSTVNAADIVIIANKIMGNVPKAPEGVEAVDLGLPNGTMWANMNVGAEKPEDYGFFFAWGETKGYTNDTSDGRLFDWASYKWMNQGLSDWINVNKYQLQDGLTDVGVCWYDSDGNFVGDGKAILDLSDDAAYTNWGDKWRMPTITEMQELIESTTSEWVTVNGVNGRLFTSKTNGKSIFLPASGLRKYSEYIGNQNEDDGIYWSSSLDRTNSSKVSSLYFRSDYVYTGGNDRYLGFTVRPVLNK